MEHEKLSAACPKCRSILLRRSRHEDFTSWIKSRLKSQLPYRCMNCDTRFFVLVKHVEVADQEDAMNIMSISLSNELKQFVDSQVSVGRYSSVTNYIQELIRKDEQGKKPGTEISSF